MSDLERFRILQGGGEVAYERYGTFANIYAGAPAEKAYAWTIAPVSYTHLAAVNTKFEEKGLDVRLDHRSYVRQGLDLIPTVHAGANVRQMEAKGIRTEKGELLSLIHICIVKPKCPRNVTAAKNFH